MIKYLAIEPEYIGIREAVARGLIPSKSWYYQKRPPILRWRPDDEINAVAKQSAG